LPAALCQSLLKAKLLAGQQSYPAPASFETEKIDLRSIQTISEFLYRMNHGGITL